MGKRSLVISLIIITGVFSMAAIHKPEIDGEIPETLEYATFGLGCFWGSEAVFGGVRGVYKTSVGYAGGTRMDPTYYSLGDHTEVVQIQFNPLEITYRELMEIFWNSHNPYSKSYKRQYMSLILYHNDQQKRAAEEFIYSRKAETGLEAATELSPYDKFYRAEDYHLKFYLQRDKQIMADLLRYYGDIFSLDSSTAAARLNALLAGKGDKTLFEEEINSYGLASATVSSLGM